MVPEVRRMKGQAPSKRCGEMEGSEFADYVLANFDLDIARHAIYNNRYLSYPGGLDTLMTFYDDYWLRFLSLDGLVWSDRAWRPMTETEKHLKKMDTKARAKKYVARC